MTPIVVGSPVFWAQVIIICGKGKHSSRIVHGSGKRVLPNEVQSVSQARLQGDGQTLIARSSGRFELIDVNESRIWECAASRQRRIDVPSAVELYSSHNAVIDSQGVLASAELVFDAYTRLCQVGSTDIRSNPQ